MNRVSEEELTELAEGWKPLITEDDDLSERVAAELLSARKVIEAYDPWAMDQFIALRDAHNAQFPEVP